MRLKYKKLIVLFSLGIMLIGFGTFSIVSPNFSFHFGSKKGIVAPATFGAISAASGKDTEEVKTEIDSLVNTYFTAKQQVDLNTLSACVTDSNHIEQNKLLAEAEYVEAYKNIQCLVLDGPKPSTYRVYTYYEVKIYDIETLIPSLTALYVTQNDAGEMKIYLGTIETEEQEYINKLDETEEVTKLVQDVQKKLEDVVSHDSDVRAFYEMLESAEDTKGNDADYNDNIDAEGQTAASAKPAK